MKKKLKFLARRFGYEIKKAVGSLPNGRADTLVVQEIPYVERPEYGPVNIQCKIERLNSGLPFEWPDILNLNTAVASMASGEKRICELGSGTGAFATRVSNSNPACFVVASEFDSATCEWARANRSRANIRYTTDPISEKDGPFDLLVTIEVIEHVADFVGFIKTCTALAPRALITTPNRARGERYFHSGPPPYEQHVREWTAGEFYWVLRCFYKKVKLFALISESEPAYVAVDVDTRLSPLIADCSDPI